MRPPSLRAIESAIEFDGAALPESAVEHLAVVADPTIIARIHHSVQGQPRFPGERSESVALAASLASLRRLRELMPSSSASIIARKCPPDNSTSSMSFLLAQRASGSFETSSEESRTGQTLGKLARAASNHDTSAE